MDLALSILFFSMMGAAAGIWLLMLTDVGRRSIESGARLAWILLLLLVPGLGVIVYYLTVVKPGVRVPEHLVDRTGGTLVSKRGQLILVLSGIALGIISALALTPVSIEVGPTEPSPVP